jgi:hypothetical protein
MWNWRELEAFSGDATGVPPVLDLLLHGTRKERAEAFQSLFVQVVNQGDLSSAAAAVTDVILDELASDGAIPEDGWLLLFEIFRGAAYGRTVTVGGESINLEVYCRGRILAALPSIDAAVADITGDDFAYAALLLGVMGAHTDESMPILRREIARSAGPRFQAAREALEVAAELASERDADDEVEGET